MKKFSTCIAVILSALSNICAQVTIDGSDFTGPGSNLLYNNATPLWQPSFDLENAGENLQWNLNDFNSFGSVNEDYLNLATLNFFYQLTFNSPANPAVQATHFIELEQPDIELDLPLEFSDIYSFYRRDADGYYQVGLSFSISGFPLITPFDDTDRIYKFPLVYDDRDTSFSSYIIDVPLLGTLGQSGWRYNHVDAWGGMATPLGTFDVLRVRSERLLTDTLFIAEFGIGQSIERPLQVDYSWIAPELDGELLRISTIGGQVISAQLRSEVVMGSSHTAGPASFMLYPNPATSLVYLRLPPATSPAAGLLEVIDARGRRLATEQVTDELHQLNVSALPQGIYLLRYTAADGQVLQGRLMRGE